MTLTWGQAFLHSGVSSIILFAIANPWINDKLYGRSEALAENGCVKSLGHLIQALIFLILIYVMMLLFSRFDKTKLLLFFKYAFYGALVFFWLTSSETYQIGNSIFGSAVASESGCPTFVGVLLQAVIFFIVLSVAMSFPKDA